MQTCSLNLDHLEKWLDNEYLTGKRPVMERFATKVRVGFRVDDPPKDGVPDRVVAGLVIHADGRVISLTSGNLLDDHEREAAAKCAETRHILDLVSQGHYRLTPNGELVKL